MMMMIIIMIMVVVVVMVVLWCDVVMMIPNDSHVFALGLDRLGDMVQKPSGPSKHGI
jgi:hypothetical protein